MLLKSLLSLTAVIAFSFSSNAQNSYQYTIDLKSVKNDKVRVELICPKVKEQSSVFVIPRVIPGSYAWKEYGRFLSDVKGFDSTGVEIKISRKQNIFYIKKNADKLYKIQYWVDDTWDDTNLNKFIFQPGGSNIESDKNFVLNGHAFMGYFEGYKDIPFEISILKPASMYGSTYLKKKSVDPEKDQYVVKDYQTVADNPIMYCKPDTASFKVDNTRIVVESFSNNGLVKADSLAAWLQPLTIALKNFLGKLPVEEYHFMFYFGSEDQLVKVPKSGGLSGYGALEHNHCSFYYLPEKPRWKSVKEMVQDVGAHEFLHIITPLNLHSEEIADFDFRNPKMSKHLWMYEGVTEYLSWLVRVQNNMVSQKEFMDEMKDKLLAAEKFGMFSFTEMSKNVLKPEYQEKYTDVYLKGAIMAMMIDQLIIKNSGGKKGLKHVMLELMEKYGAEKSFSDESFIQEFTALTYPEVGEFINRCIVGTGSLFLPKHFDWFGYNYTSTLRVDCFFIGFFSYSMNDKQQLVIGQVEQCLYLRPGDIILKINETVISDATFDYVSENYFQFNPSPNKLNIEIIRGGMKELLTVTPFQGANNKRHIIEPRNGTLSEISLRNAWLKGEYIK